jgi:hypothetical protein
MRAGFTSRQAFVLITLAAAILAGLVWLRNILIYS